MRARPDEVPGLESSDGVPESPARAPGVEIEPPLPGREKNPILTATVGAGNRRNTTRAEAHTPPTDQAVARTEILPPPLAERHNSSSDHSVRTSQGSA